MVWGNSRDELVEFFNDDRTVIVKLWVALLYGKHTPVSQTLTTGREGFVNDTMTLSHLCFFFFLYQNWRSGETQTESVKTGIVYVCQKLCTVSCKKRNMPMSDFCRTLKTPSQFAGESSLLGNTQWTERNRKLKELISQTQALYFLYCTKNCCTNDN